MESSIAKHTRQSVRLEFAGRVLADLLRMNTVLGPQAAHRALGIAVPAVPSRFEATLNNPAFMISLDDINIDQLHMGRFVMAMYDYAYEHRYPVGVPMYEFKAEMEHVEDFVVDLESEIINLFMGDPSHMGEAADAEWEALPNLYAATYARLNLDMGESMFISDIAILANMAEKSVRNAATTLGENKLSIKSIPGIDTCDFVDNDEARRWLSSRRGFVPTHFGSMTAELDQHPESLNSLFELGSYIDERWTALNKTPETVHKELSWNPSKFDYLNAITGNPHQIDPKDCADLARSLQISESWLTSQVMRNLFPHQVELLLQREQQMETVTLQARVVVKNERICSRVLFVLHDGTQLFPIRVKDQKTSNVAFRLSKDDTGGNTKDKSEEVDDEATMIDLVCKQNRAIRLSNADGSRQGIYRKTGRSVRHVELDGVVI
jgi:hypothetical protein